MGGGYVCGVGNERTNAFFILCSQVPPLSHVIVPLLKGSLYIIELLFTTI